jgi:UDP-2,3-diacylglucosamine hydrolase
LSAAEQIGLIAGSGKLPHLFAQAAREHGLRVIAVGHQGETERDLEAQVDALTWVKVGQVNGIVRAFQRAGGGR